MQLKSKNIIISAAVTGVVSISNAGSGDVVKFQQEHYAESDDRIKVDYTILDIKKELGTDFSLSASFTYDEITGGTPIFDSISSPSPCTDESGSYICDDPERRPGNLIGDGQIDLSDFVYRNIEMVDERKAINTSLTYRTPKRNEWGFGVSYSEEDDFKSTETSLSYLHYLDENKNQSISAGVSVQGNESYFYFDEEWKDMDIWNTEITFTQIFTPQTLAQITFFRSQQSKALTNPYQTVIRRVNEADAAQSPIYRYYRAREVRPDEKNQSGIALYGISELKKGLIVHGNYRYYKDDWDIQSHTAELKSFYNVLNNVRLAPMIRYYTQSEASFWKDRQGDFMFSEDGYATSDDRLGEFDSWTFGFGVESDLKGKWDFNLNLATQETSYDLKSHWISTGVSYEY